MPSRRGTLFEIPVLGACPGLVMKCDACGEAFQPDAVSAAIRALRADEDDKIARARVELLCKKMSAIYDEKFEDVPELAKRLAELDSGNAGTSDAAK